MIFFWKLTFWATNLAKLKWQWRYWTKVLLMHWNVTSVVMYALTLMHRGDTRKAHWFLSFSLKGAECWWIHQASGCDVTYGPLLVPIVVCPHSTGPKILTEVTTLEERCPGDNCKMFPLQMYLDQQVRRQPHVLNPTSTRPSVLARSQLKLKAC